MTIEFEKVKCNFCGRSNFSVQVAREDLNTFLPGKFTMVECNNCGLIYQNPRPSQSSWEQIYPEKYDQYKDDRKSSSFKKLSTRYGLRKRINSIRKYCKGGNLCDIGCSTGEFINEINKSQDWVPYGVEPSFVASEIAQSKGLNVVQGFFEGNVFTNIFFDVITMWNVIEHLIDPSETLSTIYDRLKPGGWLIFTTPNPESLDHRIFRQYWIGYELPRHYYVFSQKTAKQLLEKSGFELVGTKCFFGSFDMSMSSLRFLLRARHPKIAYLTENLLFSFPIRLFTAPFFWMVDSLKMSTSMTFFARKRKC